MHYIEQQHKWLQHLDIKHIPSYVTLLSNSLILFKSFEERGVQKPVFKDYFKTKEVTGSGDYAKLFRRKY